MDSGEPNFARKELFISRICGAKRNCANSQPIPDPLNFNQVQWSELNSSKDLFLTRLFRAFLCVCAFLCVGTIFLHLALAEPLLRPRTVMSHYDSNNQQPRYQASHLSQPYDHNANRGQSPSGYDSSGDRGRYRQRSRSPVARHHERDRSFADRDNSYASVLPK
jgi:hypothetical protein